MRICKRILFLMFILIVVLTYNAFADDTDDNRFNTELTSYSAFTMICMHSNDFANDIIYSYIMDNDTSALAEIELISTKFHTWIIENKNIDVVNNPDYINNMSPIQLIDMCYFYYNAQGKYEMNVPKEWHNLFSEYLQFMGYDKAGTYDQKIGYYNEATIQHDNFTGSASLVNYLIINDRYDSLEVEPEYWEDKGYYQIEVPSGIGTSEYPLNTNVKVSRIYDDGTHYLDLYFYNKIDGGYFTIYLDGSRIWTMSPDYDQTFETKSATHNYWNFTYRSDYETKTNCLLWHIVTYDDSDNSITYDFEFLDLGWALGINSSDLTVLNYEYVLDGGYELLYDLDYLSLLDYYFDATNLTYTDTDRDSKIKCVRGIIANKSSTISIDLGVFEDIVILDNPTDDSLDVDLSDATLPQLISTKFPFSLPFDLLRVIETLKPNPYEYDDIMILDMSFDFNFLNVDTYVPLIVDLRDYGFDKICVVTRYLSVLGCIVGLIYSSKKFSLI